MYCSSRTLASSKARTPNNFATGTRACSHLMMSTAELSCLMRFSTCATVSASTRSILFTRTVLENAICAHAVPLDSRSPLLSSSFPIACLASTRAMTLSMTNARRTSGFTMNDCTTGAGSAAPVSSISTPSNWSPSLRFIAIFCSVLTRSPRMVQQTQPLSSTTSSSAKSSCFCSTRASSMLTSPTSFSITANFLSLCSVSK
mmetsp:Transcript_21312/g.37903  ORF Transcript_21312/g.37903 Transcript_21312/m.37903 type:complete len:202 (+) Transcript_21312:627-1232(+)